MCGIVGYVSADCPVDPAVLEAQRDAMVHRGPDSSGLWVSDDRRVGLAHRRLAIIDLSPGGHQPMVDPLTGNVITFNGEIYNFRRLRAELESLGERFSTSSDTEVILAGYRRWGSRVLGRLDGMFAFAVFNAAEQTVLLARDRAGEKPLFVHRTSSTIRFASELKALFVDPAVQRRINPASLEEYLTYGYVSGDRCLISGIEKLSPGAFAVFSLTTGTYRTERYWQLPTASASAAAPSISEAEADHWTARLDVLLKEAVADQLVADVPVGVLLSGGLDSSLIAAYARTVTSGELSTFTVRMRGADAVDESPFAASVARHLGTTHHELDASDDTAAILPQLLAQYDEPIADSSMVPTFLVSSAIRQHATVAIGGDGGDELFGGYFRYPVHVRQGQLRARIPAPVRSLGGRVARLLPEATKGKTFLDSLASDDGASIANVGILFDRSQRVELLGDDSSVGTAWHRRERQFEDRSTILQRSTAADFCNYMVDDVLVKVDRASMLASLEVRAPFLHRPVIEFAFGELPDVLRATVGGRKLVLRRLARKYLPADFDSVRKQGFSIPLRSWLSASWRPLVESAAAASPPRLSRGGVQRWLASPPRSDREADRQFALLALIHWANRYGIS
jgi:asparagine synthase (glutamine-hydrolysing)